MSPQSTPTTSQSTPAPAGGETPPGELAQFGPNEWLVDEIYQQYLHDPESVDKAWWDFFNDYQPAASAAGNRASDDYQAAASGVSNGTSSAAVPAQAPTTTPAPAEPLAKPVAVPGSQAPVAQVAAGVAPAVAARAAEAEPTALSPKPTPQAVAPTGGVPRDAAITAPPTASTPTGGGAATTVLKGPAARLIVNMNASLEVPTATSVRAVPAKLLIDNRVVINNHLKRARGGKVSFTHLIGYAMVQATKAIPAMNASFAEVDGKPALVTPEHINFGLAIDLQKPDGSRTLVVPSIKAAELMDFREFWQAYEDLVRKARNNKLTADDFAGTTISLTNPGGIGTVHSVPRLMKGQGTIIGVGAMEYPAEYQGASQETLNRLAVSKIMTMTSTYDHRVIQGAQSGEYLKAIHQLLLGADDFFDRVFESLRIPYEPVRWVQDIPATHENDINKTARVLELIDSYRTRGHLMADTDPLEYKQRRHPDLDVVEHGLTLWDLERDFATGGFGGKPIMKLRDILGVLRDSYCRTVGIEYMHIQDPAQRKWIQAKVENGNAKPSREEQLRILNRLNAAEAFETFLQVKYVGQKRFSLEGGESAIASLDQIISAAAENGLDEAAIGMPHRGRLNVLTNIVGKPYGKIFDEFEGNLDPKSMHGSGDVKYHLGTDGTFTALNGSQIKVSLTANPSHLEAVDPVLEGFVRAKQDIVNKAGSAFTVLPILMHGDAAFAGQGVVAETLNMSQLRGFRTGGTIHLVVNNQVGFTTSPAASRSSVYCTDVARMVEAPIFHVNGDDPEACVRVAQLAFEFRQEFKKDVVIDMVCYRRRGHNEGDDPSMTQPLMYKLIEAKRSVRKLYTEGLIGRGDITIEEAEAALKDYQAKLEQAFAETKDTGKGGAPAVEGSEAPFPVPVATGVSDDVVKRIVEVHVNLPEGFQPHQRVLPQLQKRAQMVSDGTIDWAMGETLAFGALLMEGVPVRLTGQDSRRGTFVQRHHVIVDRATAREYTPLSYLAENQATYTVYDSMLSEFAAMGFEYGYSVARPNALVLWEAQFGDFGNGAQTIVDEFISDGEQKWGQRSGVVLLLPHGYEGQGPDHSSARIERYLQLCAQNNMTVAMPSLPSSYFHLLRWQALNPAHKPLVVFTPKSMLRLKAASSKIEEFTGSSEFRPVIGDSTVAAGGVRRVLVCSGKVYWDLVSYREKHGITDTAIVRAERLYPLPGAELLAELAQYPAGAELRWVQEEPANQGAWPFMALHLPAELGGRALTCISRPGSSSPAVGSHKRHEVEQQRVVEEAFAE